jgi:hypothetical protein
MEENVQRVFSIMIAVIVFFLLPMYVAFEKKDDIAYALAVRITSELTENVKNNGYLSKKMYDDYVAKLAVTGNTYEIKMEHKAYKYNPVICSYTDATFKTLSQTFEYELYKTQYLNGSIAYNGNTYGNLQLSYVRNEEVYTEKQILSILSTTSNVVYTGMTKEAYSGVGIDDIPLEPNLYSSGMLESVYTLSKGDDFSIRVKNVNTTTAEIFFNTLTLGMVSNPMPRVYVNYGCTVQSEKYKNWVVTNSGYTGTVQEVTIAETGTYTLEVWGASGGDDNIALGAPGGYSKGNMYLTAGTKLYVYAGGKGASHMVGAPGGFNGGGTAGYSGSSGGGGGATDIRIGGTGLVNRVIVAGGGGGAGYEARVIIPQVGGGPGGGPYGGNGYLSTTNGASQVSGGTSVNGNGVLGIGANHSGDGGGGGGGNYGGGAGNGDSGGGGGSGYIGGVTSGEMQSGVNTGNGMFKISFVS